MNTLRKKIMKRVYYAYALRAVMHPVTIHGVGMLTMVVALTYFVSIPHVVTNLLDVRIGELGRYMYGTVAHTEVWTLVLLGGLIFSIFSLRVQLRASLFSKHQHTQVV